MFKHLKKILALRIFFNEIVLKKWIRCGYGNENINSFCKMCCFFIKETKNNCSELLEGVNLQFFLV